MKGLLLTDIAVSVDHVCKLGAFHGAGFPSKAGCM